MENFIFIVSFIISDNFHPVSECTGLIAGCRLDKSELLSLKSEIEWIICAVLYVYGNSVLITKGSTI